MAQTYAEGGGGYQLEYWVGAYYLAAMFGNGHPQGGIGRVTQVKFQRGTLGDVVVYGDAPGGACQLDLQVKTSLRVSATQGDFAKVVRQMYDRVVGQPLNRGRDKYGVAVVNKSRTLDLLHKLGERALRHLNAADFYSTASALNTDERRVLDVVTDILRGLESVEDAEEAAWRLLGSGLVVLELPVDDETGSPRSSLRSWIERHVPDPARRQGIESSLVQLSAEYDVRGGSLDRQRLSEDLLNHGHRLTQDASSPMLIALESMASVQTDEVLAAIPEDEVDRVSLDVRPYVDVMDRAILNPGDAIAEMIGDGKPLREILGAQGDRSIVMAGRAHIPLAALTGYFATDRARVRVLDWHPNVGDESWSWPSADETAYPELEVRTSGGGVHAAVLFSLSFAVGDISKMAPPVRVIETVGTPDVVVRLTHPRLFSVPTLRARSVRSARQTRAYGQAFRGVLDGLTGRVERVDVFYAGPLSVAFEIGRSVAGTFHPPVRVWNYANGRYRWGLELNPRSGDGAARQPRAVVS